MLCSGCDAGDSGIFLRYCCVVPPTALWHLPVRCRRRYCCMQATKVSSYPLYSTTVLVPATAFSVVVDLDGSEARGV